MQTFAREPACCRALLECLPWRPTRRRAISLRAWCRPQLPRSLVRANAARHRGASRTKQCRGMASQNGAIHGKRSSKLRRGLTFDRQNEQDVRSSNRPSGVKRFQTIHRCGVDVATGSRFLRNRHQGPSSMGFEDEVEQSLGRPCRLTRTVGPSGPVRSVPKPDLCIANLRPLSITSLAWPSNVGGSQDSSSSLLNASRVAFA